MTDEQIKQNAEAYADEKFPSGDELEMLRAEISYIAGAHSRDEEIKELNGQVTLHKERADYYHDIYMKLRTPWISVEERLPKKWKRIKVHSGTGEACWAWVSKTVFVNAHGWENDPEKAFYDFDSKIWWSEYGDNIENLFGAPEYWMPIPELKK